MLLRVPSKLSQQPYKTKSNGLALRVSAFFLPQGHSGTVKKEMRPCWFHSYIRVIRISFLMKQLFSVPNLLSLGNLLCGCIATLNIIEADFYPAAICVALACVFDFLDGFAARGLKQGSPMGKELDSLADMVTFGVVPGMVMFQLIKFGLAQNPEAYPGFILHYLPFAGFLIPLFSGLRLAKFNVDTRQSTSFIGLPTLANAILITSIPLALELNQANFAGFYNAVPAGNVENNAALQSYLNREAYFTDSVALRLPVITPANENTEGLWDCGEYLEQHRSEFFIPSLRRKILNPWLLLGITIIFSTLLVSPIPMFSFKIKNVKWKGNETRYVFLGLSVALLVFFRLTGIPLIIVLYILMSVVNNLIAKKEPQ